MPMSYVVEVVSAVPTLYVTCVVVLGKGRMTPKNAALFATLENTVALSPTCVAVNQGMSEVSGTAGAPVRVPSRFPIHFSVFVESRVHSPIPALKYALWNPKAGVEGFATSGPDIS